MSEVTRSHPPALRKTVEKTLRSCNLPRGSRILLGVSGGSDSMALLHVMATLQDELEFKLYAVGVNHNLRDEAGSELEVVKTFAKSLSFLHPTDSFLNGDHGGSQEQFKKWRGRKKSAVPFFSKSIHLESGGNMQERARDARYKAIREVQEMVCADYIATAHHLDDKAETVLMRIIRGTSVKGLDVLPPLMGDVLRPMINAKKRDVMLHIQRKSIHYCEDPSNKNTEKYLRSKIRYDILPELKKINPNILDALCELSISAKNPEVQGTRLERRQALDNNL